MKYPSETKTSHIILGDTIPDDFEPGLEGLDVERPSFRTANDALRYHEDKHAIAYRPGARIATLEIDRFSISDQSRPIAAKPVNPSAASVEKTPISIDVPARLKDIRDLGKDITAESILCITKMAKKNPHPDVIAAGVTTLASMGDQLTTQHAAFRGEKKYAQARDSNNAFILATFRIPDLAKYDAATVLSVLSEDEGKTSTAALGNIADKYPEHAREIVKHLSCRNTKEALIAIVEIGQGNFDLFPDALEALDRIEGDAYRFLLGGLERRHLRGEAAARKILDVIKEGLFDTHAASYFAWVIAQKYKNLQTQAVTELRDMGTERSQKLLFKLAEHRHIAPAVLEAISFISIPSDAEKISEIGQLHITRPEIVGPAISILCQLSARDSAVEVQLGALTQEFGNEQVMMRLLKNATSETVRASLRGAFDRADSRSGKPLVALFDAAQTIVSVQQQARAASSTMDVAPS